MSLIPRGSGSGGSGGRGAAHHAITGANLPSRRQVPSPDQTERHSIAPCSCLNPSNAPPSLNESQYLLGTPCAPNQPRSCWAGLQPQGWYRHQSCAAPTQINASESTTAPPGVRHACSGETNLATSGLHPTAPAHTGQLSSRLCSDNRVSCCGSRGRSQ